MVELNLWLCISFGGCGVLWVGGGGVAVLGWWQWLLGWDFGCKGGGCLWEEERE